MERQLPKQRVPFNLQTSQIRDQTARLFYKQELVESVKRNPKLLYKYLNSQQVVKDSIKALRRSGEITQEPVEIANLLNKCFQDVFVIEDDTELPLFAPRLEPGYSEFCDLEPEEITFEMVAEKLKQLEQNKACGAWYFHTFFYRNNLLAEQQHGFVKKIMHDQPIRNSGCNYFKCREWHPNGRDIT